MILYHVDNYLLDNLDIAKEYSATKAALAGVVDFAIASVIIKPVSKQLDKFKKFVNKNPELIKDKIDYLKDKKKFASFQKVVGYIPKYLTIPIKAAVTILLIPPTLKILFPNHSKSKVAEKKTNDTNIQNNKNQFLSSTQLETMSRQLNDKSVKLFESYSDQNIKMIKNLFFLLSFVSFFIFYKVRKKKVRRREYGNRIQDRKQDFIYLSGWGFRSSLSEESKT